MRAFCLTYLLLACTFLVSSDVRASVQDSARPAPGMLMETVASESLMLDIRSALFDFDLELAKVHIAELSLKPDGLAAAHYHECLSDFLLAMFEQTDSLSNKFIDQSKKLLDSGEINEDDPWGRLMKAELNLQQAFVHARQGRNLKAALAARRAFKLYRHNIDRYPAHWDSYKGYGVLQIMIGSVPSSYRRLLSILGYKGSVETGLRSLKLASEKAHYFKDEALTFLAMADLTVNQSKLGGPRIIEKLYADNSKSPFFALLQVYSLQSSRNSAGVVALAEEIIEMEEEGGPYVPSFAHYFLGDAYFKLNRFDEAIPHLSSFASDFEGKALLSPAHTKIGLSYDVLGERDQALKAYELVMGESEFDVDVYARKTAARFLETAPSKSELEILIASNLQDAGESEDARSLFLELLTDSTLDVSERAQVNYMLGRTYHHEGQLDKALEFYVETLTFDFDRKSRWLPWAAFYAGESWEELGDADASEEYYKRALDFEGDFDYKRSLEQKTKAAIDRVGN